MFYINRPARIRTQIKCVSKAATLLSFSYRFPTVIAEDILGICFDSENVWQLFWLKFEYGVIYVQYEKGIWKIYAMRAREKT